MAAGRCLKQHLKTAGTLPMQKRLLAGSEAMEQLQSAPKQLETMLAKL